MLCHITGVWSLVHQMYWKCSNIKTLKQFQRNGLLSFLILDIMNYLWTELQAPVVTFRKEDHCSLLSCKLVMSATDKTVVREIRPRWLSWMRHPTGDQEVMGSTLTEVGNILSWRLKYFLWPFSPFRWFKKGTCQFLAKECAQYW